MYNNDQMSFDNLEITSKLYKPTREDLKLLTGTQEWQQIGENEGLSEANDEKPFKADDMEMDVPNLSFLSIANDQLENQNQNQQLQKSITDASIGGL